MKRQSNKAPKLPDLKAEVRAMLLSAVGYLEHTALINLLDASRLRKFADDETAKVYEDAKTIAIAYIKKGIEL